MSILCLMGESRAGKDTVAEILCKNFNFVRVALGDPIREIALIVDPYIPIEFAQQMEFDVRPLEKLSALVRRFNWDGAKKCSSQVTATLIAFGQGMRQWKGDNFWLAQQEEIVHRILISGKRVVVTDLRQPNEYEFFNHSFKFGKTRFGLVMSNRSEKHPIDNLLSDKPYDYLIQNHWTIEDLSKRLRLAFTPSGATVTCMSASASPSDWWPTCEKGANWKERIRTI